MPVHLPVLHKNRQLLLLCLTICRGGGYHELPHHFLLHYLTLAGLLGSCSRGIYAASCHQKQKGGRPPSHLKPTEKEYNHGVARQGGKGKPKKEDSERLASILVKCLGVEFNIPVPLPPRSTPHTYWNISIFI